MTAQCPMQEGYLAHYRGTSLITGVPRTLQGYLAHKKRRKRRKCGRQKPLRATSTGWHRGVGIGARCLLSMPHAEREGTDGQETPVLWEEGTSSSDQHRLASRRRYPYSLGGRHLFERPALVGIEAPCFPPKLQEYLTHQLVPLYFGRKAPLRATVVLVPRSQEKEVREEGTSSSDQHWLASRRSLLGMVDF